jgi:hypothetical protein
MSAVTTVAEVVAVVADAAAGAVVVVAERRPRPLGKHMAAFV